jgi:hypothetical protein
MPTYDAKTGELNMIIETHRAAADKKFVACMKGRGQ